MLPRVRRPPCKTISAPKHRMRCRPKCPHSLVPVLFAPLSPRLARILFGFFFFLLKTTGGLLRAGQFVQNFLGRRRCFQTVVPPACYLLPLARFRACARHMVLISTFQAPVCQAPSSGRPRARRRWSGQCGRRARAIACHQLRRAELCYLPRGSRLDIAGAPIRITTILLRDGAVLNLPTLPTCHGTSTQYAGIKTQSMAVKSKASNREKSLCRITTGRVCPCRMLSIGTRSSCRGSSFREM